MRIAVFASGTGSNAEALIQAAKENQLGGEVVLLVSDKPEAGALKKAESYGIKTVALALKSFATKAEYEAKVVEHLQDHKVDFLCLAGYMRLVGSTLLTAYEGRIVNIHPSLLPAFPGLDAVGQALTAGVSETGVTIHFVDAGMDTGPIIAQETVLIQKGDTSEDVMKKIQAVEHQLYPRTVKQLMESKDVGGDGHNE
ncbi:phosphoribosylglycinamide formyltransferase [Alkalicoccobacillus murimartini]|uniref:Phosphoribosylglycinamide formyltransferase n=1 Tax=Alkalicoccobacillus murimartini TaxID=171685 RepID=A0ABT9YL28_9BACI|nr:phosphoribosylglycinamide formyltransferase [Alkalicoccobacillus murimartini]MDQ0208451.1 phosphoribosylglycinamide formyltransferase-1 [Alkalicoccobacillus murimartini]